MEHQSLEPQFPNRLPPAAFSAPSHWFSTLHPTTTATFTLTGDLGRGTGKVGVRHAPHIVLGHGKLEAVLPWTHGAIVHSSSRLPLIQVKKASEVEVAIPSESPTAVDWGSGPV